MIDAATVERYGLPGHLRSVPDEIGTAALPVTGVLPPELAGRYVRNGPNALPGQTSTHFQIGPGMLHGVRLRAGRAEWYRNRWVRTGAFHGHPFAGPGGRFDLTAVPANTHVIGHARRMFALVEAGLPYEVTPDLDAGTVIGEAVFVPATAGPRREDDGWLISIATRRDASASRLLVFDAADLPAGPVAAVELPRAVPTGFHGSWFPDP